VSPVDVRIRFGKATSEQTIMSIAGHVSARMLAQYSHIRLEAKRTALSALCNTEEKAVTSQSASQASLSRGDVDLKLLKSLVDVTGIEPVTPCLQRMRFLVSGVFLTATWESQSLDFSKNTRSSTSS
jgi:hypothetical protein